MSGGIRNQSLRRLDYTYIRSLRAAVTVLLWGNKERQGGVRAAGTCSLPGGEDPAIHRDEGVLGAVGVQVCVDGGGVGPKNLKVPGGQEHSVAWVLVPSPFPPRVVQGRGHSRRERQNIERRVKQYCISFLIPGVNFKLHFFAAALACSAARQA